MKPTYEIENFQFFNADNMEIMKQYPDKFFDLAIVDPPYGIGERLATAKANTNALKKFSLTKFKESFEKKGWDVVPEDDYFTELIRISKNQIIWGGNYFPLPPTRCILCWDKMTYIPTMSQIELAWTSFDSPARLIQVNSNNSNRIHPTEKPIKLYEWILSKYANENDKIIDTHLGSGSIAIAIDKANQLDKKNLSFVGIELDEDYFNASIERFLNHKLQLNLF